MRSCNRVFRAQLRCELQGIFATRQDNHVRACGGCELCEQQSKKSSTDDADAIAASNLAALENIHRTAQGLTWERLTVEFAGQTHRTFSRRDVVLGVRMVRDQRDAISHIEIMDTS